MNSQSSVWLQAEALHIVRRINEALENKQYCSAAFSDISQAFDKIWHTSVQDKTVSPSELFTYPKTLFP
jgi:hypothetical protein